MSFSRICSWAGIITLCVVFLPALPAKGEEKSALVISNPRSGLLEKFPLGKASRVSVRFFHSYDRQWVTETFAIQETYLVPLQVVYLSDSYDHRDHRYPVKTEVGPHEIKQTVIDPSDGHRLSRIIYRVSRINVQELILKRDNQCETYSFARWGRPGERLILSVKRGHVD